MLTIVSNFLISNLKKCFTMTINKVILFCCLKYKPQIYLSSFILYYSSAYDGFSPGLLALHQIPDPHVILICVMITIFHSIEFFALLKFYLKGRFHLTKLILFETVLDYY